MTKRYLVEFISTVTEQYTAEVEVPDHIGDDDLREYLREYLQEQVAGNHLDMTVLMDLHMHNQNTLASYLTAHEEIKEDE